ncbi:MAG: LytTR family DNA-binding domain-containing protein [Bacteroidota bacterium]
MNKLNCYIIDDEQHARDLLRYYIENNDALHFSGSSNNAVYFDLQGKEIDLLFLDIEMPGMSGIEFLKKHKPPFKTILTTAYRQYAIEGYELGVTDYLLKPILSQRFEKAIDRVLKEIEISKKAEKFDYLESRKETFTLRAGAKSLHLSSATIKFIEAKSEYVAINTIDKKYLVYMRMKEIEQNNHFNNMVRIHRSFFINPRFITERTAEYVVLDGLRLPIGRSYRSSLKSIL